MKDTAIQLVLMPALTEALNRMEGLTTSPDWRAIAVQFPIRRGLAKHISTEQVMRLALIQLIFGIPDEELAGLDRYPFFTFSMAAPDQLSLLPRLISILRRSGLYDDLGTRLSQALFKEDDVLFRFGRVQLPVTIDLRAAVRTDARRRLDFERISAIRPRRRSAVSAPLRAFVIGILERLPVPIAYRLWTPLRAAYGMFGK
jgi:hypothetical protein